MHVVFDEGTVGGLCWNRTGGEQHLDDARSHGDDEGDIRTVPQTKGLAGGERLRPTCAVLLRSCAVAVFHTHAWRSLTFSSHGVIRTAGNLAVWLSHPSRAACRLICSTHRSSGNPWGQIGAEGPTATCPHHADKAPTSEVPCPRWRKAGKPFSILVPLRYEYTRPGALLRLLEKKKISCAESTPAGSVFFAIALRDPRQHAACGLRPFCRLRWRCPYGT